MKYTLKYHKHRLRLLLAKEETLPQISYPSLKPCLGCPARIGFESSDQAWIGDEEGSIGRFGGIPRGPCIVCQGFLEISGDCPCNVLGSDAIRLTLKKLQGD
uniref:Uncharacterized protein n=1 Tax=viral metagenome TaxID=1070528 RepID=A0A6M3LP04_9ZZZZ